MDTRSLTVLCLVLAAATQGKASGQKRAVAHKFPEHTDRDKTETNLCPDGQLMQRDEQNNTVCCLPTACDPGHFILQCTENGREDKCMECPSGFLQPNYISSANMTESRCFPYKVRKHDNCPRDTKNHSQMYSENCPLWCACNIDKCRIGDPCFCRTIHKCDVNEEFDLAANKCVPCPWYAYKNVQGCQRCDINVTLWRLGNQHGEKISTVKTMPSSTSPPIIVTQKESSDPVSKAEDTATETDQKIKDDGSQTGTITVVIISISLSVGLIVVVVAGVCLCRRSSRPLQCITSLLKRGLPDRQHGGNTESSASTPLTDQSTLLEDDSEETKKKQITTDETFGNVEIIDENKDEKLGVHLQTLYERKRKQDRGESSRRVVLERSESEQPLIGRQESVTVDAEIHSSSSNGSYSEEEDMDRSEAIAHFPGGRATVSNRTSAMNGVLPGSTARDGVKAPTITRAIPAQGPSLTKKLSLESDGDTGIDMQSILPDSTSNVCRGENALTDPSCSRVPIGTPDPSVGERVVIGDSAPSSIRNLPQLAPLKIGTPSDSSSNSSVQSPVGHSPSPRITFEDNRKGRKVGVVSPQPREIDPLSYQPSNSIDSDIPSYPMIHHTLDNGYVDIARISDVNGQSGNFSCPLHAQPGEYMYSDSNNNSLEPRLRGRFDPDGASTYARSESSALAEQTERKELVPESDEYHQTSAKFVDPDDTQCKSVEIDKAAFDKKDLTLKHGDDTHLYTRPVNDEILAITENSSSVAGQNDSIKGRADTSVMEGQDLDLDDLKGDSELTKTVESETVASRDELVGANAVLTDTVTSCDSGREPEGGSQHQEDDESFELPNSALEQYESKQREGDTE